MKQIKTITHIKSMIDSPRDMDRGRIQNIFQDMIDKDYSIGIHASPVCFNEGINSNGLVQGKKMIDRGSNLPGIHFAIMDNRQTRWYVQNGKMGPLINKVRATFGNVLHVAMRRGDRHFTIYLFDAKQAIGLNGKHEVVHRTRAFDEIRLIKDDSNT
ncbi:MAG: hypothetical protein ABIH76_02170, partial [Candidatus Bathyarchaeota archaeon]